MALTIQIDATQLTCAQFLIPGVTGWLETKSIQTVQLEPGKYGLQTPAGLDTSWGFEVRVDGTIAYESELDVGQGGFLGGNSTAKIAIIGYAIDVDVTQVTTPNFHLSRITSWLAANTVHTLRLLPGSYHFVQGNGAVPEAYFQIDLAGKIDYPASSDGILTGRGSARIAIFGYAIDVDVTQVTTPYFHLSGITSWLAASTVHTLRLLPGSYHFVQGNGAVPEAYFQIDFAGKVNFPAGSDGILTGRGTARITISGYAIDVDVTQVTTPYFGLSGITSWLAANTVHTLRLLPGSYLFMQGSGAVPEADFQIDLAGKIDYPASSDGILTGRGSARIAISGHAIEVDVTQVTTPYFHLSGITSWLAANTVHTLRLLPGSYLFMQGSGAVPEADFQIDLAGKIDYPTSSDGILTGRGTARIAIFGYAIDVDVTEVTTPNFHLSGITSWLAASTVHTLRLLPGSYQFVQSNGSVAEAEFKVVAGGTVDYDAGRDVHNPDHIGFLEGRGTARIAFVGYAIQLDATALAADSFHLTSITGWLNAREVVEIEMWRTPVLGQ